MRGHFRRFLLLVGIILVSAPVLAACSDGDDDDQPTPTTETEQISSPTPADDQDQAGQTPTAEPGDDTPPASPETAETEETDATPTLTPLPTGVPQPTETPVPEGEGQPEATTPSSFAFGWNVAVRGDDDAAQHNQQVVQAVQDSGFDWVRFQLEWRQFERQPGSWDPLPMDRMVEAFASQGINILVVVAKPPEWAVDPSGEQFLQDYGEFQELMAFLANRYQGQVQAWEIWNEQNMAHEVGGNVRIEDYANLLRAGSQGVRSGDPNALVVFGGLTPNGVNDPTIAIDDVQYLQMFYEYNDGELMDYYDILGVHLNSTNNSPDHMWPDNPGPGGWSDDESFYFRRAEELREVMVNYGDETTDMWITEFGWTTENQAPGYEYGADNSPEDVAQYLTRSLEIAQQEWDYVSGAFVWNLNWSTLADPSDEKYPWSALNEDWSPRPAYEAVREYVQENQGSE